MINILKIGGPVVGIIMIVIGLIGTWVQWHNKNSPPPTATVARTAPAARPGGSFTVSMADPVDLSIGFDEHLLWKLLEKGCVAVAEDGGQYVLVCDAGYKPDSWNLGGTMPSPVDKYVSSARTKLLFRAVQNKPISVSYERRN